MLPNTHSYKYRRLNRPKAEESPIHIPFVLIEVKFLRYVDPKTKIKRKKPSFRRSFFRDYYFFAKQQKQIFSNGWLLCRKEPVKRGRLLKCFSKYFTASSKAANDKNFPRICKSNLERKRMNKKITTNQHTFSRIQCSNSQVFFVYKKKKCSVLHLSRFVPLVDVIYRARDNTIQYVFSF